MVLEEWLKIENEKMFHSSELDLGNKAANHFNLLIKLINLINKIYKIIKYVKYSVGRYLI